MAEATALELETLGATAPARRLSPRLRQFLSFLIILFALAALWEGYKALGAATQGKIPFTEWKLPVRSDDKSMPHISRIVGALFAPAQRGKDTLLVTILLRAVLFTWREAALGFAVGSLIGFALRVVFV